MSKEVTTVNETIDAEMAIELLKLNRAPEIGKEDTNRSLRQSHIEDLAAKMLRGEWTVSNQGIGVALHEDGEEELIDGQHRLEALLLAAKSDPDITIESLVTWNLPATSKLVVDIGAKRRNGDFLSMQGYAGGTKVAAALKLLHCYYDIPYNFTTWLRHSPSPTQLIEYAKTYPGIEEAYRRGHGVMRLTSPSSITAVLTILERDRPDLDSERFLAALKSGVNLNVGSPILALRNWCLNASDTKKRVSNVALTALLLRTVNHWTEGTSVRHLVFRESDATFPRLTKKEWVAR